MFDYVLHSLYFLESGTSIHAPRTYSDILLCQEEKRITNSPIERKHKHKKNSKKKARFGSMCQSFCQLPCFHIRVCAQGTTAPSFVLVLLFWSRRGGEGGRQPHSQLQGNVYSPFVVQRCRFCLAFIFPFGHTNIHTRTRSVSKGGEGCD